MSPERPGGCEKTTKGTTVLNVESASRLLTPAVSESKGFVAEDFAAFEVPDEFYKTEERLREIGFTRAEPLVLPQRTLLENDRLWKRRVRPEPWFWDKLQYRILGPESAILQQGVYLIDGRPKPDYQDGEQKYEDDEFMGDMIEDLRRSGAIQRSKWNRCLPEGSRFGRTPEEIEQIILPEFVRRIGKDALGREGRVVNNPYKIFNLAGNMRHPEWGKTNTEEWFGDKVESGNRLFGGHSRCGGLAHVAAYAYSSDFGSDYRVDGIGFRPLIAFTSKT